MKKLPRIIFSLLFLYLFIPQVFSVSVAIFYGDGCPHCAKALPFLEDLSMKNNITLYKFEVYHNRSNKQLWQRFVNAYNSKIVGVPTIFIGDKVFVGFVEQNGSLQYSDQYKAFIGYKNVIEQEAINYNGTDYVEELLKNNANSSLNISQQELTNSKEVNLPIFGKINIEDYSLLVLTIIIAGLDSFNPCALWVLTFLLSLLVYTHSRRKMIIIGSIFVITSAAMYFLFMAAWLNLFLLVGYKDVLRVIVGLIAIIAGAINIKELFAFGEGVSLTIPTEGKKKLVKKMREVINKTSIIGMVLGTILLAITANLIEGICTAGLPIIYTRILTLKQLSAISYYLYLLLYNIIYIIPYTIVVLIFIFTLGSKKITEREGKILKLISGLLMLILGLILLIKPELLVLR